MVIQFPKASLALACLACSLDGRRIQSDSTLPSELLLAINAAPSSSMPRHSISTPLGAPRSDSMDAEHTLMNARFARHFRNQLNAEVSSQRAPPSTMYMGGPISLLPPVVTLVASVLLRQTICSLIIGIWTGALILSGGNPIVALMSTFDNYILHALADPEHVGVILFTMILGGTLGIIQKSGGALGLASLVKGFFTSRKNGMLATMGLGSLVFFDDYSSILIVGNSLRPLIAAVRLSAAKFAFISHTMAVCLASLSPLSSWVGVQIGYIAGAFSQLGGESVLGVASSDPFVAFLTTIPYRFFPLSMLIFLLWGALTERDFGPMLAEERATTDAFEQPSESAKEEGEPVENASALDPAPGTPLRASNALLPLGTVLVASFAGMILQGLSAIRAMPIAAQPPATIFNAIRYADSISALLWGSVAGCLVCMALVSTQKILNLTNTMAAWTEGAKEVLEPTIVLVLAWALGAVVNDVGTAEFLAGALQTSLPAWAMPALVSCLCYIISFASGSAIGTMGIVFPLVGPLAMRVSGGSVDFLMHCFGSIMGGSLFGNLCSPLADTSILAALATRCSLTKHIGTCIGYTSLVGLVALFFGDIAVGLGLYGPVMALVACASVLLGINLVFGRATQRKAAQ